MTLPWTKGNLLATVTSGPVAVISGTADCSQIVALGSESVEPTAIGNGLLGVPESYLDDILARCLIQS